MSDSALGAFWEQRLYPDPRLRLHLREADYSRAPLEVAPEHKQSILSKLEILYGAETARACYSELERVLRVYYAHKTPEMIAADQAFDPRQRFTEKDVLLITYGDLLRSPGKAPLQALSDILTVFVRRSINTVHLLPFFPYSSDRGFSVMDYEEVDPGLGTWDDVERLSLNFHLMFDGVINHVSAKSRWFQRFLDADPFYGDFFITFSTREAPDDDHVRLILRPRTSKLLTSFQTLRGPKLVWTTFSPDQVDLNYKNPQVLLRILEILLYYVRRGADIIRLDAVTYVWHELGTSCAHLRQTHALVQLLRAVLDAVAPQVALLTETNVPHQDNISYLGDGTNEARMVYNFALPPLVLYTLHSGNCRKLSQWAARLEHISDQATYLNFLASHDGIGVLPVRDLLAAEETDLMIKKVIDHGGLVSYRTGADGNPSPYELNSTWFSALNPPESKESAELQADRFVASHAIAAVLHGVPAIYLPSLWGSRNDTEAVLRGEEPRSINRRTATERELWERLGDSDSSAYKVCSRLVALIEQRVACPAFHPNAAQRVLQLHDHVFMVIRESPQAWVLALTNVTAMNQEVRLTTTDLGRGARAWKDFLGETELPGEDGGIHLTLRPYQTMWLTPITA
jgi:sucrose phosphorylase